MTQSAGGKDSSRIWPNFAFLVLRAAIVYRFRLSLKIDSIFLGWQRPTHDSKIVAAHHIGCPYCR